MSEYAYLPLRTNSPSTSSESSFEIDPIDGKRSSIRHYEKYDDDDDDNHDEIGEIEKRQTPRLSDTSIRTILFISIYFLLNLSLTFYNKSILINFPFPYFMTSIHAGAGTIGCLFLRRSGIYTNKKGPTENDDLNLERRQKFKKYTIIFFYSTLYAANIAISNASLHMVSVPFHQIVRSTCPIICLGLEYCFLQSSTIINKSKFISIFAIVFGAILACFGEMNASLIGIVLTFLGTILAALKTVITNVLQGGKKQQEIDEEKQEVQQRRRIKFDYSALELLEIMSPLAFVQCLFASFISGELKNVTLKFQQVSTNGENFSIFLTILIGNGLIAFLLNIVSFKTNKIAGPLTMTVVANFKQVMTILIAFQIYNLPINPINLVGICISVLGTAWYGFVGKKRN